MQRNIANRSRRELLTLLGPDDAPDEEARVWMTQNVELRRTLEDLRRELQEMGRTPPMTQRDWVAGLGEEGARLFLTVYRPDLELVKRIFDGLTPDERQFLMRVCNVCLFEPARALEPLESSAFGARLDLQALDYLPHPWSRTALDVFFLRGPKQPKDLTCSRESRIMQLLDSVTPNSIETYEENMGSREHPTGLAANTRAQIAEIISKLENRELADTLAYHYSAEGNSPRVEGSFDLFKFMCSSAGEPATNVDALRDQIASFRTKLEDWLGLVAQTCEDPIAALAVADELHSVFGVDRNLLVSRVHAEIVAAGHRLSPAITVNGLARMPFGRLKTMWEGGRAAVVVSARRGERQPARAVLVPDFSDRTLGSTPVSVGEFRQGKLARMSDVTGGVVVRLTSGIKGGKHPSAWLLPPVPRTNLVAVAQLAQGALAQLE